MGIEAIGSIGRVASIEGGFRVGRISNPFKEIGNAAGFVENRGPSILNPPSVETIRNPFASERVQSFIPISEVQPLPGVLERKRATFDRFSVADVVAEAEVIVRAGQRQPNIIATVRYNSGLRDDARVRNPEPAVVRLPNPARELDARVISKPFPAPKVEAIPQTIMQKRAASVDQVVEERKMVTEDKKEEKTKAKKSEKQSVAKIKLVEAVQISEKRRLEIKAAVKRAKVKIDSEGLKAITGRLVARLLSPTFWEHKSPIVGQGRDGTLNPTAEAIRADLTEYTSEEDAQRGLVQAVSNHIPVKEGEGGRTATLEEVRQVLEGKEAEPLKAKTPVEIVVRRLVRKSELVKGKQVVTVDTEEKVESSETSLKDFPALAEVFQKAA